MKQAYTRFRDKGFEIVSFTIDEERENWEQASVEEEIPWFDLGMGPEAEAPIAYKVIWCSQQLPGGIEHRRDHREESPSTQTRREARRVTGLLNTPNA